MSANSRRARCRRPLTVPSGESVMSAIEDYRVGPGIGRLKPWNDGAFKRYNALADDCMGPWLVYWRQNFPGLNNRAKDDDGRAMKNWWPFLFY